MAVIELGYYREPFNSIVTLGKGSIAVRLCTVHEGEAKLNANVAHFQRRERGRKRERGRERDTHTQTDLQAIASKTLVCALQLLSLAREIY